jgi:serine/threonine protein kinase
MSPAEKESALQEVRVLSLLKHPNIVQYIESIITESTLCIVMAVCGRRVGHVTANCGLSNRVSPTVLSFLSFYLCPYYIFQ